MKQLYKTIFFFLPFSFLMLGCDKTDLTPGFIEISVDDLANVVDVTDFNTVHGTSYDSYELATVAHNFFTNVNVYVDGENLGCWELPCKVPVLGLKGDSAIVQLVPCFRKNGMYNTIQGYPFFSKHTNKVKLSKGETYSFSPEDMHFKYHVYAKFPILETFNASTTFTSIDSSNVIEIMNENGNNVGLITLQKDSSFTVISEPIAVKIGADTYLEISYKVDNDMHVGIYMPNTSGFETHYPIASITGTSSDSQGEWKTIYIDLFNTITRVVTSSGYNTIKVSIAGISSANNSKFYLDNIKLVTTYN